MRAYRTRRRRVLTASLAAGVVTLAVAGAAWGIRAAASDSAEDASTRSAATSESKAASAKAADTKSSPPVKAAIPATTESRPATLSVAGFGDMIFDREVSTLISYSGGQAPLAAVADRLSSADLAVGNLESTLASSGTKNPTKDVTFRGDPRGIAALEHAGVDAVSLANNHVLDYGPQPLLDTIAALDKHGIAHAGAGANKTAAWTPATIERRGAKTAYLAFSHIVPAGFIAQDDRAGFASGRMDMGLVDEAIREARRTHDYVIVSFHWGVEYADNPTAEQVENAHRAIDAGADMVLAHHPHVIQGVEFYKKGLIAYSLGDFVFDHYSRKTGEAFILNAKLGPDGVSDVSAVPVYLDGYGRPEVVTGSEASVILKRLKNISSPLGSTVEITGDTASVRP